MFVVHSCLLLWFLCFLSEGRRRGGRSGPLMSVGLPIGWSNVRHRQGEAGGRPEVIWGHDPAGGGLGLDDRRRLLPVHHLHPSGDQVSAREPLRCFHRHVRGGQLTKVYLMYQERDVAHDETCVMFRFLSERSEPHPTLFIRSESRVQNKSSSSSSSSPSRCVSMFFVEFQLHFGKDYSTTAWIHSLIDCTTMLCGETHTDTHVFPL